MANTKGAEVVAAGIKALIEVVRAETASGGPASQRAAALAVTSLEQAGMWAERALLVEDAIEPDRGEA